MPQLITDNRTSPNHKDAISILNDRNTIKIGDVDGVPLYVNERKKLYTMFDVDDVGGIMFGYYNKYVLGDIQGHRSAFTQTLIWKKNTPTFKNMATKVFFHTLLHRHPYIISDSKNTMNGKTFWLNVVKKALSDNLKVGILDIDNNSIQQIQTYDLFLDHVDYIWGVDQSYKNKRVYIDK